MLEMWSPSRNDEKRAARLAIGGVVGVGLFGLGGMIAVGSAMSAAAAPLPAPEEDVVEVALVETPEELPEPEPVVQEPQPRPGPRLPAPTPQVTAVPDTAKEADATYGDAGGTGAPEAAAGSGHGTGTGVAIPAPMPPPPPPAPPPRAKAPSKITEDIDPPRCSFGKPRHPAGVDVEGTVAVKFVVGEDGSIRDVKVVRGPAELHAAAIAAVASGRCTPARRKDDGTIVSVSKVQPFRFRLQ